MPSCSLARLKESHSQVLESKKLFCLFTNIWGISVATHCKAMGFDWELQLPVLISKTSSLPLLSMDLHQDLSLLKSLCQLPEGSETQLNPCPAQFLPVFTFFFRLIDSTFCFSKRILLSHRYGLQSSQRGPRLGSLPPKRRVFPNINIGGPQAIIKACIEVKPSLCNNICVPVVSWCWEGQEGAGVPEGLWQGASPPAGGT